MKKIIAVGGVAAAALLLTGCGAAETAAREAVQVVNPWQDSLRESMEEEIELDGTDLGEMCLGLTMFGVETPEQIGAIMFAFDESGDLPNPNMTIGEWAAQEGEQVPFSLPTDLTVREVANEAGAYLLDQCGIDY